MSALAWAKFAIDGISSLGEQQQQTATIFTLAVLCFILTILACCTFVAGCALGLCAGGQEWPQRLFEQALRRAPVLHNRLAQYGRGALPRE